MKVATVELKVARAVRKGDAVSLMSLFDSSQRFERFPLEADLEEEQVVTVRVGSIGEWALPVGADMVAGHHKTLMTMFWYRERTATLPSACDVEAGQTVRVEITTDGSKTTGG